jgi:sensor domain CHASE-containing protein
MRRERGARSSTILMVLTDPMRTIRRSTAPMTTLAHPTPEYFHSVFGDDTADVLGLQRINFIAFIDNAGQIVEAKSSGLSTRAVTTLPGSLMAHIPPKSVLLQHRTTTTRVAGVILLPEGPLLVVSRPIVRTNFDGPSRGTFLTARFLDSDEIQNLAAKTHLSLTVHLLDGSKPPADLEDARAHLPSAASVYASPLNPPSPHLVISRCRSDPPNNLTKLFTEKLETGAMKFRASSGSP